MIYNIKGDGRNPVGSGPRRLAVYGGRGARPGWEYDDGLAGDFPLSPALNSLVRLQILSVLCVAGEHHPQQIADQLGTLRVSVSNALWGMRNVHLVENELRRNDGHPHRSGAGWSAQMWRVTDSGRKWLWRYGWVTGRVYREAWRDREFEGQLDLEPWKALRIGGQDPLCRPAALATAAYVTWAAPVTRKDVERSIGVKTAGNYLYRWQERGWCRRLPEGDENAPMRRLRNARPWMLTPMGRRAVMRHAEALKYAAQRSGYTEASEDTYFTDVLRAQHPSATEEQVRGMEDGRWWPENY